MYSDEEFALILHKAAELAKPSEPLRHSPGGLTLAEVKAAAVEAGFDPDLIERAARLLPARGSASPSLLERLMGGQPRQGNEVHFSTVLDEPGAARLLSAIRIDAGQYGGASEGHSGPTGMTWHTSSDLETFSVTARPVPDGTAVTVALDRRGALVTTGAFALCGSVLAGIAGLTLASELAPALGVAAGVSGIGAVLTVARGYWASSTRTARERIERVVDAASRSLDAMAAARGAGEKAATAEADVQPSADAS